MTNDWHRWLIDRQQHREPVDRHFEEAFAWIKTTPPAAWGDIFELGPGSEGDLTNRLRNAGRKVYTADIRPSTPETPYDRDLSTSWVRDRRLPFDDDAFGSVLAREVLEHVDDLDTMLREILRVLMPGGRLWFSAPFIFPLHDYETGDYWRISDTGWAMLLDRAGFHETGVRSARLLFNSWQLPATIIGWAEKLPLPS